MNERPTPETDALEQKQLNEGCPQWNDMMRWVREHAALARKLEAERDEAREVLKTIASWQGGLGAKWPMEIARDFLEAAK